MAIQPPEAPPGPPLPAAAGVLQGSMRRCAQRLRRSLLLPSHRPIPRLHPPSARTGSAASLRTAPLRVRAQRVLAWTVTPAPVGTAPMVASSQRPTPRRPRTARSTRGPSMAAISPMLGRSSNAHPSTPRVRAPFPSRRAGSAALFPAWAASPKSIACRTTRQPTAAVSLSSLDSRVPPHSASRDWHCAKWAPSHRRPHRNSCILRPPVAASGVDAGLPQFLHQSRARMTTLRHLRILRAP
jgi:hypothetical protein